MDLFRKKEINLNHTSEMKKELKTSDLIMLGIGAIIGTGIFVVTGLRPIKMLVQHCHFHLS